MPYQARSVGLNGDISGHQADIGKLLFELTILLVAESFDGRRVDHALLVSQAQRNRI